VSSESYLLQIAVPECRTLQTKVASVVEDV